MILWVDGNDSNMDFDFIMVLEQGRKSISRNTHLFMENDPWRKLIARKQKWVCTFGKAF